MLSPMRSTIWQVAMVCATASMACILGCHHEHHEERTQAIVVEPGYYYDTEYRDEYGHEHPREYWYYDGHRYEHRDGPPPGSRIHPRQDRDIRYRPADRDPDRRDGNHDADQRDSDRHLDHPGEFRGGQDRAGDHDVPGERLHGNEVGPADRPGQIGPRDR